MDSDLLVLVETADDLEVETGVANESKNPDSVREFSILGLGTEAADEPTDRKSNSVLIGLSSEARAADKSNLLDSYPGSDSLNVLIIFTRSVFKTADDNVFVVQFEILIYFSNLIDIQHFVFGLNFLGTTRQRPWSSFSLDVRDSNVTVRARINIFDTA